MKSAREAASDILVKVDAGGMSHAAFNEVMRSAGPLSSSDRDFVKALVNGTLEHLTEIDKTIDGYSKKGCSSLKPIVRNVLRISIYQLKYMPNIPQSAVCNEAVKIIDRRRIYGLKGYVNAVLRNCSANVQRAEKSALSEIPEYIYGILERRAGKENVKVVIQAFDRPGSLSCRFNLSRKSRNEIISSLTSQGIKAEPAPYVKNGYILSGYGSVGDIQAFKDGYIQIQGISSMLAAEVLDPAPGSRVLDICAAPGGKTVALADIMQRDGQVIARDLTAKKVKMIENNALRTGMDNITAEQKDACVFYPGDTESFDYIMADLPCSGLGTIGHKPEIRYRVTEEKVKELAALQRRILDNAVRYLKSGGRMVYSTCTLSFEENEENFAYIRDTLGLTPVPFDAGADTGARISSENGCTQLLPGIDDICDGFFISLFEKAK